jgi:hypothetical protein
MTITIAQCFSHVNQNAPNARRLRRSTRQASTPRSGSAAAIAVALRRQVEHVPDDHLGASSRPSRGARDKRDAGGLAGECVAVGAALTHFRRRDAVFAAASRGFV